MVFLFYLLIFLFGSAIGSFLNVLAERLPRGESVRGRSRCGHCGRVLGWRDLIPVFSFLFLRGRCRKCGEKISWQYPVVEIATGVSFLVIFNFQSFTMFRTGFSISNQLFNFQSLNLINLFYLLFVVSCLIVIFVSDLKYFIIPDEIIIAGVIGTLFYKLLEILRFGHWDLFGIWNLGFGAWRPLLHDILIAVSASAFFLLIVLLTRGRGMGLGDVKLAFLMGLILGWPNILLALLIAFISGAFLGIILILAKKAKMKSEIPFGPFLIAGTFLALFFGQQILSWYFPL